MDRLSECVIVRLHRWKLSYWADWTVAVKVTPPLYVMTPILDLSVGDYLCMKGFIQDWLLAFTVLMLSWHLPKCRLKAGKLKAISVIFRVLQYCKKKKKKFWLWCDSWWIIIIFVTQFYFSQIKQDLQAEAFLQHCWLPCCFSTASAIFLFNCPALRLTIYMTRWTSLRVN